MKRLAYLTAIMLLTAASFVLVWMLSDVFVLFFVSIALAAALRPLVITMRQWNLSDGMAILVCYAALLVCIVGGFLIFGSLLGSEFGLVLNHLPTWYDSLRQQWGIGPAWQQAAVGYLPSSDVLIQVIAVSNISTGTATLLNLSTSILNGFIFVIGVLSMGYYWLVDQSRFERLWLSLLPVPTRVRARSIWRSAEHEIGTYIRVELVIVVTVALFLLCVYTIIGLPFAGLLSLASGFIQLLPWLGGSLMLIVALTVALSTGNTTVVLVVLLVGIAQEVALASVIRPRLYRNAQKLNSLLVVVLLLALSSLGGLSTALLAQPLAALIQVVYQNTILDRNRIARSEALPELDRLSERAAELEETIAVQGEVRPELRSLVLRVRSLMQRTRDVVSVSNGDERMV